jgi:hypothetical protein
MLRLMRSLVLCVAALLVAGCHGRGEGRGGGGFEPQDFGVSLPGGGNLPPLGDGGDTLGSGRTEPPATTALHVAPDAALTVGTATVGFVVTANGRGGYRVAWVDTAGAGRRYHGSVFCNGTFGQIASVGMQYAGAVGNRLDFESAPGSGTSGYVDFVSSVDPIVVDALNGAAASTIYYFGTQGGIGSVAAPATFTSP